MSSKPLFAVVKSIVAQEPKQEHAFSLKREGCGWNVTFPHSTGKAAQRLPVELLIGHHDPKLSLVLKLMIAAELPPFGVA